MMNPTDLDAQINNSGQREDEQEQIQRAPRSFWQRNWPRVFLALSVVVVVLTFVAVILNFIKIIIKPNVTLLNIYCLVFSLLALSAELRQFRWFRKISYHWMKYVYFLTYYKPRGVFYIVLGLLLLGDMAILYVAGAVSMFVGLVIMLTSFFVNLPVYDDPQERKREQEEARRYYEGKNATLGGPLVNQFSNANDSTVGGDDIDAGRMQSQHYQPPTLPLQESHQVPLSPPGRGEERDSSLNSPPGRRKDGGESTGTFSSSHGTPATNTAKAAVDWGNSSSTAAASLKDDEFARPQYSSSSVGHASQTAATTLSRQATSGRTGEIQLRRDFAAAMEEGESLR